MALTRAAIRKPPQTSAPSFFQQPIHSGSAISATDFSVPEVRSILESADALEKENPFRRAERLAKRRVALLFYESSTRTRTSFELAAKALGADTTLVSSLSSSIEKGESLKDTGITLKALGAECIILRSPYSGAPYLLAQATGLPVLNGGDGMAEHPSQALLDLRTMLQFLQIPARKITDKVLRGVTISIVGDILHSRVARSNALLLPRLGAEGHSLRTCCVAAGNRRLHDSGLVIERDYDAALRASTIVMMLRIQAERLAGLSSISTTTAPATRPAPIASPPPRRKRSSCTPAPLFVAWRSPARSPTVRSPASRNRSTTACHPDGASGPRARRKERRAPMKPILIRNGRLIDPATNTDAPRDLLLRDGKVAAIEASGKIKAAGADVIDAKGLIVAPGLIDIHVHLREPGQSYKETIATGTAAAAAGGFTTVCAMPNTVPVNDTPEITRWMQSPERGAAIRVLPHRRGDHRLQRRDADELAALKDAGAVAVTDDGRPILGDAIMLEALRPRPAQGLPVIQHAEDTRLTGGCSMNAGALAFRLGLRGMPIEAESGLVERDIALVRKVPNAHLHVAHLSTKKALDAVRAARKQGLHVTCEVTPHHFALTEERIGHYDTNAKMNPPLRAESDRAAMIEGLLDGTIDAIATDHAPHAAHEKEQEFDRAPNGITGLETALGLALRILHTEHKMPLANVLALLTTRPAQALGLKGMGILAPSAAADLILFDPAEKWTFHAADSKSKSKNTPFDGWELNGRVHATIFGGKIIARRD